MITKSCLQLKWYF